jgi:resuscitation-promoting factor RpfA
VPGPSSLSLALTPRRHARHAKPSVAAPVLVAGGMTLGLTVAAGAAPASAAAPDSAWDRLAQCESGGRWNINTGNGYYGGLQFNLQTWRGVGGSGYPHQASRETQIAMANRLHDARGFQPWPSCSKKLGLRGGGGGSTAAAAAPAPRAAAKASRSRTSAAPAFDGHVMSVKDRGTFRKATRAWQAQMKARGWKITVDGYFGPQSASVAQRFAAQKGLKAAPGTVNAAVFTAAWTLKIT